MRELCSTHNATRIQSYYSFKLSNRIIQLPTGRDGYSVELILVPSLLEDRAQGIERLRVGILVRVVTFYLSLQDWLKTLKRRRRRGRKKREREKGDRKERVGREMLSFLDQRDLNFQWENSPTLQQSIQNTPTPPHPHPNPTTPMPQKKRKKK